MSEFLFRQHANQAKLQVDENNEVLRWWLNAPRPDNTHWSFGEEHFHRTGRRISFLGLSHSCVSLQTAFPIGMQTPGGCSVPAPPHPAAPFFLHAAHSTPASTVAHEVAAKNYLKILPSCCDFRCEISITTPLAPEWVQLRFHDLQNNAKPKYSKKKRKMETAQLGKTSQIWLKGFDTLMRGLFSTYQSWGVFQKSQGNLFLPITF